MVTNFYWILNTTSRLARQLSPNWLEKPDRPIERILNRRFEIGWRQAQLLALSRGVW